MQGNICTEKYLTLRAPSGGLREAWEPKIEPQTPLKTDVGALSSDISHKAKDKGKPGKTKSTKDNSDLQVRCSTDKRKIEMLAELQHDNGGNARSECEKGMREGNARTDTRRDAERDASERFHRLYFAQDLDTFRISVQYEFPFSMNFRLLQRPVKFSRISLFRPLFSVNLKDLSPRSPFVKEEHRAGYI